MSTRFLIFEKEKKIIIENIPDDLLRPLGDEIRNTIRSYERLKK